MKKFKHLLLVTLITTALFSCSKDEETSPPPTPEKPNTGEINFFEGKVPLVVKESITSEGYQLIGEGKYGDGKTITIKMIFPEKPAAGKYIQNDEDIKVTSELANPKGGSFTFSIIEELVINVTTDGETLKASFTNIEYAKQNSKIYFIGFMRVN